MKKVLVLLLCALAVFAIVSCKNDPKVETFKVTFETGEGATQIDPATVNKGEKVEKPADPVKLGAEFGGWFTEAACENAYNFDTAVTKDLTLYAKWTAVVPKDVAKVTITVGYEEDKDNYDRFQLTFSDVVLKKDDVVTFKFRSTREFDYGFSLRDNASGSNQKVLYYNTLVPGMTSDPDEDGWITFTFTMPEYMYEKAATQGDKKVDYTKFADGFYLCLMGYTVKEDYVEIKDFKVNDTKVDVSKATVKKGSVTMIEDHKWEVPKTCVVLFYSDPLQGGGTDYSDAVKADSYVIHEYGAVVERPAYPVREGYDFKGWNKEKAAAKQTEDKMWDFDTKNYSTRRLYAAWAKETVTKITLTVGDGSSTGTKRMDLRYDADYADPMPGDVLTFKYRSNTTIADVVLREAAATKWKMIYWGHLSDFISEPDADGWITFTYTFSDKTEEKEPQEVPQPLGGFRLEFGKGSGGETYFSAGDYIEIKALTFNGRPLEIVGTEDKSGSKHGPYKAESAGKCDITTYVEE